MRDDFAFNTALSCGLGAAVAAVVLIGTPVSIPLFVIAGGAAGVCIGELGRTFNDTSSH